MQIDEIWAYVHTKQKRLKPTDPAEYGDQYTFVALCGESKLAICHRVGKRDGETAFAFLTDLRRRTAGRIQLSSDQFTPYAEQVEAVFGSEVDYAQLLKVYASVTEPVREAYNPSKILGIEKIVIQGRPETDLVSTSYVERQNLTMRMAMRRFTRMTNAFSKKLKYLKAAVDLHFCHYNFCRIHSTIRCTPAMESGIADHIWDLDKVLGAA